MTRRALSLAGLFTLSLACSRGPGAATDPPKGGELDGDAAARAGEGLAIVAVVQRPPPASEMWLFEPGGQRIAAENDAKECGIWDIPSGLFVGFAAADDPRDPCVDWPAGDKLLDGAGASERSSDGTLEASFDGSGQQVEVRSVASGELLSRVPVSSRGSLEGLDLAWTSGPSHELAVLATDPPALEVWNLDGDPRPKAVKFDPQHLPVDGWLAWREDGLTAVTRHDAEVSCEENGTYFCEYDDSGELVPFAGEGVSSFFWPDPVDSPTAATKRLEPAHADGDSVDFAFDDQLRWLAFTRNRAEPRAGVNTRVWAIATGPSDDPSIGFYDQATYEDYGGYIGYMRSESQHVGQWRVGAEVMWLEERVESGSTDEGSGYFNRVELSWSSLVTLPVPSLREQTVITVDGGDVETGEFGSGELEVFVAGGSVFTGHEVCFEQCETELLVPEVCEARAGAPRHELILADCDGQLALVTPAGEGRQARIDRRLPFSDAAELRWGQAGWLALLEPNDGKLEVIDPGTGELLLRRGQVAALPATPLAVEQDRLAVAYDDRRFELLEPARGEAAVLLSLSAEVDAAALSPDGQRVAVGIDGRIDIYVLDGGERVASWPRGDAKAFAWRQDGAALLTGDLFPERAYDATSGELLAEIDFARDGAATSEHIDPSWRWVSRGNNSYLRILDGRTIELGPGWARLDSGQFEGEPPYEKLSQLSFRVGSDPEAVPRYTREQLARWLSRPGLVEDFFAGKPIAAPTIPATEATRLLAGQAP